MTKKRKRASLIEENKGYCRLLFWLLFISALALRLWLSACVKGYAPDVSCFYAWMDRLTQTAPWNYYASDFFCDYPPGYFPILYLVGLVHRLFGIPVGSPVSLLMLKLPSVAADMLTGAVLYQAARKKDTVRFALIITALYWFNPIIWIDSAVYGQVDALVTLLGLLILLKTEAKQYRIVLPLAMLAVLVKPQALLFMPLVGVEMLCAMAGNKTGKRIRRDVGSGLLYAIAVFAVVALPYLIGQEPLFIFKKYASTVSGYPYAALNVFNFYTLFGLNFASYDLPILGIPAKTWGTVLLTVCLLGAVVLYLRWRKKQGSLMLLSALFLTGLYLFATKMHERYIVPAMVLYVMAYLKTDDRRILLGSGVIGAVSFLSIGYTLIWTHLLNYPKLYAALSLIQIVALIYLLFTACSLFGKRTGVKKEPEEKKVRFLPLTVSPASPEERLRDETQPLPIIKRERVVVFLLTAVYAVFAFLNLGTIQSPRTWWETDGQTTLEVTFNEEVTIENLLLYAGIGQGNISASGSLDGENWFPLPEIEYTHSSMYRWQPYPIGETVRYLKLQPTSANMRILEFGFVDSEGKTVKASVPGPYVVFSRNGAGMAVDEQDTVASWPDPRTGMYFDELYHARTAYEFLNGWSVYENTHPPLGKIIIGLGISMFGMDPFGWRVMGTLFGVAMIPLMYVMAKTVFRNRRTALVAAFLLAFDNMHLAQTRIATIDSYSVFFIMLMVTMMAKFVRSNFNRDPLSESLKPLAGCGIAFGLGAATKWICLYSGIGLAVLFFHSFALRFGEYRFAKKQIKAGKDDPLYEDVRKRYPKNAILTILWCILFFIVIPAAIYLASYIPFAKAANGDLVSVCLQNQKDMLSYHSQLVDQHPYASPWWEWMIMWRPTFYYSSSLLPEGQTAGISCLGNPVVWWFGAAALLALIFGVLFARRDDLQPEVYRVYEKMGAKGGFCPLRGLLALLASPFTRLFRRWREHPMRMLIIVSFASQFLPWVLVPRSTFLYHYFASLPFVILCLADALTRYEKQMGRKGKRRVRLFLALCAAVFIFLLPAVTGIPIPVKLARAMRWLPEWVLFLV